jgi:hypothetical protein
MSVEENFLEKLQRQSNKKVSKVERGARKIERVAKIYKHFVFIV